MKIETTLIALIFSCLFFVVPAHSQTTTAKDLDSIPGTWMSMIVKATSDNKARVAAQVTWRIHKVDRNKNEIQMSENFLKISDKDTIEIERPRISYPAKIQDTTLVVQVKDIENASTTFTIKLNLGKREGMYLLLGEAGDKDEKIHYGLAKMNSDTTNVSPKIQWKRN